MRHRPIIPKKGKRIKVIFDFDFNQVKLSELADKLRKHVEENYRYNFSFNELYDITLRTNLYSRDCEPECFIEAYYDESDEMFAKRVKAYEIKLKSYNEWYEINKHKVAKAKKAIVDKKKLERQRRIDDLKREIEKLEKS